ncbi:hypothetical protein ATN84_08695 [Paramesorhizobium deserti]|uniref:Uncharacterized protein n=1 Tax=Paramesorhizobium deserti TaxID=1494590 RepID=A0A135HW73_9HYPH|nr:hypothetical protein [Paramesorhizobium deserti]KXF77447.1 hypothetical protein ATN84_08695 [Paramesorhizobium deserti]
MKIVFGSWPIRFFASIPFHNFLALVNEAGEPVRELNGGARKADGTYNYQALHGPLTVVETDYSRRDPLYFPEFHIRPSSRFLTLFEGNAGESEERWADALAAARAIECMELRYSLLRRNSNSVAAALVRAMGLTLPRAACSRIRAPGGRCVLPPVTIGRETIVNGHALPDRPH